MLQTFKYFIMGRDSGVKRMLSDPDMPEPKKHARGRLPAGAAGGPMEDSLEEPMKQMEFPPRAKPAVENVKAEAPEIECRSPAWLERRAVVDQSEQGSPKAEIPLDFESERRSLSPSPYIPVAGMFSSLHTVPPIPTTQEDEEGEVAPLGIMDHPFAATQDKAPLALFAAPTAPLGILDHPSIQTKDKAPLALFYHPPGTHKTAPTKPKKRLKWIQTKQILQSGGFECFKFHAGLRSRLVGKRGRWVNLRMMAGDRFFWSKEKKSFAGKDILKVTRGFGVESPVLRRNYSKGGFKGLANLGKTNTLKSHCMTVHFMKTNKGKDRSLDLVFRDAKVANDLAAFFTTMRDEAR